MRSQADNQDLTLNDDAVLYSVPGRGSDSANHPMPVIRRKLPAPTVVTIPTQPRLLSIPQVASYLNTSVYTVRELLRSGDIPRIKLGRKFLADRQDVDAYVVRSKEAAA